MKTELLSFALFFTFLRLAVPLQGQQDVLPLSDDLKAASSTIAESDVLATVSFLASDEMAGRDTPSPELRIASAFVASRFRGAGLEGLGEDGSFFLPTQLPRTAPNQSADVSCEGNEISLRGVLFSPAEATVIRSVLQSEEERAADADERNSEGGSETDGDRIVIVPDVPLDPRVLDRPAFAAAVWVRRLRPLVQSGVSAVVVSVGEESLLPEVTRLLAGRPTVATPATQLGIPVVLIDGKDADSLRGRQVELSAPAVVSELAEVRNVIGILRGRDPESAQEAVLITAHLDHIGSASRGEDRINNGADDNATGVTAVIKLADAYASLKEKPKRSVIFMTFWGEEDGLRGSAQFAEDPVWPLENIVANVNIEMIGRPEDGARYKAWMTGWTHSDLGELLHRGSSRIGVDIFHREDVSEMLYTRSDNFSFVRRGVIAHSVSAGSLHTDYHQPTDEWQKLDIPHMTKIIQGLLAGTHPIADAALTPARSR